MSQTPPMRPDAEDRILTLAREGAERDTLLEAAGDDPQLRALAEDLAALAPALRASETPQLDPALLWATRRAASLALAERRRRRAIWAPAVAMLLLPFAIAVDVALGWGLYTTALALLPDPWGATIGTLAVSAFAVASLTLGTAVYGGLPLLYARATVPVTVPASVSAAVPGSVPAESSAETRHE